MDKGDNLAFHLIQSFKPGEIDAETAHRLGQQFADEVLKGKYEYVISTHVDKDHIHNHILFNAASFVSNHKYVSNKRSYHKICRISNRICQENGLATSMPTGEKGKSYKENMEYHRGTSWKVKLRVSIDKAIWSSINYEEFLQRLNQQRLKLNMTQEELCKKLGIDQSQYSKMELGKTVVSYRILEILLNMEWDVDFLVTGKKSVRRTSELSGMIGQGAEKDRQELLSVVAWLLEQGIEIITLHDHVIKFQETQAPFHPLLVTFCRQHAVHTKMRPHFTQHLDIIQILQPICIINHQRFPFREINETAHLLLETVTIVLNRLFCHHLAHIGSS